MRSLENLDSKLLKKIFHYLTFEEISQLRGVSINLHKIARQHLNSAFLELGPRLITKYTQYLMLMKTDSKSQVSGDAIFQGCLLKLLTSEHAILLALCRNYITNGRGCFTPGEILDLFIDLQSSDCREDIKHEEDKKLARLLSLIDRYLDWFENYRITTEEHCSWYGTCVIDLLDSYLNSSYDLLATHDGRLVKLSGRYVIKGQSEIPPRISEPLGCRIKYKELLKVLKYIRKHVRWSNFVTSFRNDGSKDFIEFEEEDNEIITDNERDNHQRSYKKHQSDSQYYVNDNVESLIVTINLQCDRFYGPARLRGGFEEMKEWRKGMENFKRSIKKKQEPSFGRNLSIINKSYDNNNDNNNNASTSSLRSKFIQLKSLKESMTDEDDIENKLSYDEYVFNLEIKSIYPIKNSNHGETFGETMLHVNHTPQHIFAAQNECNLY